MRELEKSIVSRLEVELARLAPSLLASGRTIRAPEIEVWNREAESYTSEILLEILRAGQIDDVLEFHIFRNGRPVVTCDEALEWFRLELSKILEPNSN